MSTVWLLWFTKNLVVEQKDITTVRGTEIVF